MSDVINTPEFQARRNCSVKKRVSRGKSKPSSSSEGKCSQRSEKERLLGESNFQVPDTELSSVVILPELSFTISCLVVITLCLVSYWNSCCGDFVFDDLEAIINNQDLRPETPLGKLFSHDFWGKPITAEESHKSYRPLTVLSFRINYYLAGGLHPWGFHLVNILLHSVVSVLVLPVSSTFITSGKRNGKEGDVSLKASSRASLLCAILFAVHPIHTENVAGVVGRADLLCALFFFLSFLTYVSACRRDSLCLETRLSLLYTSCHVIASVSLCAISMLCKEQGITVIGVCSIYDIIISCCIDPMSTCQQVCATLKQHAVLSTMQGVLHSPNKRWLRRLIWRHILLLVSAVSFMWIRLTIMGSGVPSFQQVDNPASFANSYWIRLINYSYVYSINVWLLLCPWWLCFDWSMGCIPLIEKPLDPRIVAPIIFWILLSYCFFKCLFGVDHYKKRNLTICLSMLIIPFLPASNIFFRVGFVVAERALYLPSVGYCLLVVMGSHGLALQKPLLRRKFIQGMLLVLVTCHVMRCIHRNIEWQTEERLYRAGLKVCPFNAKVHFNIGKCAADQGQTQEAIAAYREAIRLNPVYDQALNNLGNILKELNQTEEAETLLTRAVTIRPKFSAAWMNLGIVRAALHKYQKAEQSYKIALTHRKNYPDCYFNLGNLATTRLLLQ